MAMEFSYGGVPLLFDQNQEVQKFLDKYQSLDDLVDQVEPTALTSGRADNRSGNGQLVGLPVPNYPDPPKIRLNQLYWPTGASRWARGYFLASEAQKQSILLARDFSGLDVPQDLKVGELSTSMSLLHPHKIVGAIRTNESSTGDPKSLWLLPLVDVRYFWQHRNFGSNTTTTGTSWATLIATLGTQLGVAITADAVDSAYLIPDPEELSRKYDNAAELLDAVAHSVGMRAVRLLDGTVKLMNPSSTLSQSITNKDDAGTPIAGEETTHPTPVPATVDIVCQKSIEGVAIPGEVHRYSKTPSPLTPDTSSGTAHAIHTTAYADFSGVTTTPTNNSALNTLAIQIASDFYSFGGSFSEYDYTYQGISEWTVSGYDDHILYNFGGESPHSDITATTFVTGTEAAGIQATTTLNEHRERCLWTRIQSSPANFGTEQQLSQDPSVTPLHHYQFGKINEASGIGNEAKGTMDVWISNDPDQPSVTTNKVTDPLISIEVYNFTPDTLDDGTEVFAWFNFKSKRWYAAAFGVGNDDAKIGKPQNGISAISGSTMTSDTINVFDATGGSLTETSGPLVTITAYNASDTAIANDVFVLCHKESETGVWIAVDLNPGTGTPITNDIIPKGTGPSIEDSGWSITDLNGMFATVTVESDPGFAIDSTTLTTGSLIKVLSDAITTDTRDLVSFVNDNILATGCTVLRVQQDANQTAITISTLATNGGGAIDIFEPTQTASSVLFIDSCNGLTTGSAARFHSNSPSSGGRNVVDIINAHADSSSAVALHVSQNSLADAVAIDTTSNSTSLQIDTTASAVDVISVDAASTTIGDLLSLDCTSESISTAAIISSTLVSSGSIITPLTGSLNELTSNRTETRTSLSTDDDFDNLLISRSSTISGIGGTLTSAGALLKIEKSYSNPNGTLEESAVGIEMVLVSNLSSIDVYAITIDNTNAGTGKPGGIDFSEGFVADDPLFKIPTIAAQSDEFGTGGYIAVDEGGTIQRVPVFTTARPFNIPVSSTPAMSTEGDVAIDSSLSNLADAKIVFRQASNTQIVVSMDDSETITPPTDGHVVTYVGGVTDKFQLKPAGGTGITDNRLVRGDSGTDIQDSGIIVDDSDNMSAILGIIATGVIDFGSATSLEIPNGTNPLTNSVGELAVDTNGDTTNITHGVLEYHDGTSTRFLFGIDRYPSVSGPDENTWVMAYNSGTQKVEWQEQAGGTTAISDNIIPKGTGTDIEDSGWSCTDANGLSAASTETSASGISLTADTLTSGDVITVSSSSSSLTTGAIISATSSSVSTGSRNVIEALQTSTAAVNTAALYVQQDALGAGIGAEIVADAIGSGRALYVHSSSTTAGTRSIVEIANTGTSGTALLVTQGADLPAVDVSQTGEDVGVQITQGALADVSLNIVQDSNSTSNIFAIKIDNDNAGTGKPGGIDMSTFIADEPVLGVVSDGGAITEFGTEGHFSVDIGSVAGLVPVFNTTHPFAIPVSTNPTMTVDGDTSIDSNMADLTNGSIAFRVGSVNRFCVPLTESDLSGASDDDVVTYDTVANVFKLAAQTGGGTVEVHWAECFANWDTNTGDWKVSVKGSTRTGTGTGSAFDVYLPVIAFGHPNLESGDHITWIEADDGVRTITSDYMDDRIGTVKMWMLASTLIPKGWGRMDGIGNDPVSSRGVGTDTKFYDAADSTPLSHTQRFPLAYDGTTPPKTAVGDNEHLHPAHANHKHVMGRSATGTGSIDVDNGGNTLDSCTSIVDSATNCPVGDPDELALGHETTETVPRAMEVHFIERLDNSV